MTPFLAANAQISGAQLGTADRVKMAKQCESRRGVLSVRASLRVACYALQASRWIDKATGYK
jgi:hypothetical protein